MFLMHRLLCVVVAAVVTRTHAFHAHTASSFTGASLGEATTHDQVRLPKPPQKTGNSRRGRATHQQCSVPPTAALPPVDNFPTSRGRVMGLGLSGWLGLAVAAQPGLALDPIRKAQEQIRIRAQEEFDNVEALASPEAGKTIQPVLTLVPIVALRLQLDEVESNLKDPRRFGDALAILQIQDFQKRDIKRVFNAYSDNIYYLPGSERENQYLQGGATPSTRQTLQYLLRNDVIDNVEALTAEIAYLIREKDEAAAGEADTDEKDMRMYLGKCKQDFDKYLGMVFQNEIDEATDMAKASLARKRKGQQQ